jgi:phytoene dehydrogenase-like protein
MLDVVVVGGGLAGLAAGTYAARRGLRVTVIERASRWGGRARSDRLEGHTFNQGGHALYARGPAARVLAELGVTVRGARPPASGLLAVRGGELHRLPSGLVSILSSDLFGFGAKIEAARALARIARASPAATADVSWGAWVDDAAGVPAVREVLHAFARLSTYANAPYRMSAQATLARIRLGLDGGVLYVDGGWQSLVDALEGSAARAGARLRSGTAVASIRSDGALFGVELTNGEVLASRAVIVCAAPESARTLLGERSLGGLLSLHVACLDVGLSDLPCPDRLFSLGLDRPTYFSVHSATARVAHTGATLHLMKYLDPARPQDAADDEGELEEVLDRVQPGWRPRVRARRFMPRLVASHALPEVAIARPGVVVPGLPGAFVAGDWTDAEHLLVDAALASARRAAELAAAHVLGAARRTGARAQGAALS